MDNSNKTRSSDELTDLDSFVQEASKSINKDNPFKLISGQKNHFLPPINTVSAFFGIKMNAKAIYEKLTTDNCKPPKVSSSSLHEMSRKGVGKTVFKKFVNLIFKASIPGMHDFLMGKNEWVKRATNVNSNALAWLGFIKSFNAAIGRDKSPSQLPNIYSYLSDFITLRCQQEVKLYELLKHKYSGKVDSKDMPSLWEKEIKPFYQKHTSISEDALNLVSKGLEAKIVIVELDSSQQTELIFQAFELEYDFLLNCIASYEVGYVNQDHAPTDCKKWLISKTLGAYSKADNSKTCFHCLMDVLVLWFDEHGIKINNRQLASCVPIDFQNKDDEVGEEPKNDAQYNKLYKWYRNIDLPSDKSLIEFLNNIAQLSQNEIDNGPFDVAKMAIGFDKALLEKTDIIKKEFGGDIDVRAIWKRLLALYPEYYYFHCYQQSSIKG